MQVVPVAQKPCAVLTFAGYWLLQVNIAFLAQK